MKTTKKAFALLLAFVLVLGLSGTAFADTTSPTTGSITVENATAGETYTAYKIFDVTYSGNAYAYSISTESAWLETVLNYIGYVKYNDKWYASTDTTHANAITSPFTGKEMTLTLSAEGKNYVVTVTDKFSAADFAQYLNSALYGYSKVNTTTTKEPASDTTYYIKAGTDQYVKCTDLKAFDKETTYYTKTNEALLSTVASTGTTLTNNDKGTATATELAFGYYFVTSSLGSLANLTTTSPDVTIYDKNVETPFDKTVDDDDVEIGQTVTYTITGAIPSTTGYETYQYTVSDTLSEGLTLNEDVQVKFGITEIKLTTVTDASAELADGQIRYTDNGFELYFDMTQHQTDAEGEDIVGQTITITYSAVVNENAVVTTEGNPNEATLEYSNDPNEGTTSTKEKSSEAAIYTVNLTIDKYAGGTTAVSYTYINSTNETVTVYSNDEGENKTYYIDIACTEVATIPEGTIITEGEKVEDTDKKLDGATFVLVKKDEETNKETFYQATVYAYTYETEENDETVTVTVYSKDGTTYYSDIGCTKAADTTGVTLTKGNVADISWVDSIGEATKFTTDTDGAAVFYGLEAGIYYLRETAAPTGYNLLTGDQEVTIARNTDDETGEVTIEGNKVSVANSTGAELPSTGGIGTTIFYVVGSILVIGAAVLLIAKKRMNGAEK